MLSGMNSVISDWLGTQLQSCSSRSRKTLDCAQACRSDKGWRFFPLYGCGKNTTACPIAWTGYCLDGLCSAGYNQSGDGGEVVFFSSNPIPPVAVAADLLAEHVLSRSAGSKGSSRITVNIIDHHSPNKAREFSGYCCNSNIPFLSVSGQPVVFAAKSDICLVCISDDICRVSLLPRD